MLPTLLLLALLLAAAVTDLARHRIYNWNTYPGILAGLIVNAVAPGGAGLADSLAGLAACGGIMLVCFVLFDVGGGDVKLMAMVGAFLGVERGIEALLWTFVLGSVIGAALLIWQVGFGTLVARAAAHLKLVWRARGWMPLTEEERRPLQRWLYLAPAALAAGVLVTANERYQFW